MAKKMAPLLLCLSVLAPLSLFAPAVGGQGWNESADGVSAAAGGSPLLVGITLIRSAAAAGAVCLDGTLPAYHLDRGFGSGANNWLVHLEGGGWCNDIRSCVYRKTTRRGSSNYMEKQLEFTGILSNKPYENPDFYNWNRVIVRYCDGASFTGDGYNRREGLYFRGKRIWSAAMQDLMLQGMRSASRALLSGCSAGGLSSILHCDEFRGLFSGGTTVKCLADAGMFLDATDVSGGHTLRTFFDGIVNLHNSGSSLPGSCTSHMDATSCIFPQNVVSNIATPIFILNAAYDVWQLQESLAPRTADHSGSWSQCKINHLRCDGNQLQFLQGFRNEMLNSLRGVSSSNQDGLFINSCFAHCQSERQDTWFANNSPVISGKKIAEAVGDWFFGRSSVKDIDCPYPCDGSCHHLF